MEKLCNGCFKKYDDKFDLCPYCGYYPARRRRRPTISRRAPS